MNDVQWAASLRGVLDPCPGCQGLGVRVYPSTATWRGGIGGQALTNGVCDTCWGSGDAVRPWLNLRELDNHIQATTEARAASLLARSLGVGIEYLRPGLVELSRELDRMSRGRRSRPDGYYSLCRYLRDTLLRFSEASIPR